MANGVVNLIINCFKKGNGAEEIKKDVDEAKKSAGQFAKGLETLGGAANVAGRMLRALLTGGLWEAGGRGITFLWEKFKEWKEKSIVAAREAAQEFGNSMGRAAEAIEQKFKNVAAAVAKAAARAKELMGLENTRGDTGVAVRLADLHEQERQALAKERNESERAIIQANYKIKQARVEDEEKLRRAVAEVTESENNIDRANAELLAARHAATALEMQVEAAWANMRLAISKDDAQMVKSAEETMAKATQAAADARQRVADAAAKVASAETAHEASVLKRNKLQEEIQDRERQLEYNLAEVKRKAAEQAEEQAKERAEAERKAAEQAEAKAKAEQKAAQLLELHERTRSELAEASCESERKVILANEKYQEAVINAADKENDTSAKDALDKARFELTQVIEDAKKAERREDAKKQLEAEENKQKLVLQNLDKTMEKLAKEIEQIQKDRERTRKGVDADHRNNKWSSPYNYNYDENGNINDFTDWKRAQRFADRADRDGKGLARQNAATAEKMKDIEKRVNSGKYVSDTDKKQLAKWKQFQKELNGEKERREKMDALRKLRDKAVIEGAKELKAMRRRLDKWIDSGVMN